MPIDREVPCQADHSGANSSNGQAHRLDFSLQAIDLKCPDFSPVGKNLLIN
jgi:hypothetical protein